MAKASAKTSAKAQDKPEVAVNVALFDLIQKEKAAQEKAASYTIEIAEFVQRENLSNAVVIKTLMEARGMTQASAASQCSRIRALLNNQEQMEKLKAGDVTVRAAVKRSQKAQISGGSKNKDKQFDRSLKNFVSAAKAYGQPKSSIMLTVETALDEAKIK